MEKGPVQDASSSAGSSPLPRLPDEVLRSFQFPDRQRVDVTNSNTIEAHHQDTGRIVQQSVNFDDSRNAAASANDENCSQSRRRNDLSQYGTRDLRLINAHYKALVSEHRQQIIREIEVNCEELGLNVRQQDWAALLKSLTAASPSEPRPGITANQTDFSHDEIQEQANPPQDVDPIPISGNRVSRDSETTLMNGGPANSSSDTPAEPETPLRPLRALRGRKRAHSQLEQQSADTANGHENGKAGEVEVQSRSPDRTQSLHSGHGGNEPGRESDSFTVIVDGVAKRTAWQLSWTGTPTKLPWYFERANVRETVKSALW